jgi:hypothetical protein
VMGWSKKVPTTASDIMAEDALPVQLTKTLTGTSRATQIQLNRRCVIVMCLCVEFLGNFSHAVAVHPTQGSVCCVP